MLMLSRCTHLCAKKLGSLARRETCGFGVQPSTSCEEVAQGRRILGLADPPASNLKRLPGEADWL